MTALTPADALHRLHTWSPHLSAAQLGFLGWLACETVLRGRDRVAASYEEVTATGTDGGVPLAQISEEWLRRNGRTLSELGVLGIRPGRGKGQRNTYWINWAWQPGAAPALAA